MRHKKKSSNDARTCVRRRVSAVEMDGFYPYGVSTTLPHHLEELGHVLAPPVTVAKFDSSEELLWTGTETGSLTLSHAPSLERHCAIEDREYAIADVVPIGGGAISVSGNSVGYHTTGGETTLDVVTGEGRDSPYTCAAYEQGRGHVGGKLYVGKASAGIVHFDPISGIVIKNVKTGQGTMRMEWGTQRGLLASGGLHGELCFRDPRNGLREEMRIDAHQGAVCSLTCQNDIAATCGFTSRGGSLVLDQFVKVYDTRFTARAIHHLHFPAGPVAIKFNPARPGVLFMASESGFIQANDINNSAGLPYQFQIDLQGATMYSMDISSSGQCMSFGDTSGWVHTWCTNDSSLVNYNSYETAAPVADATNYDFPDPSVTVNPFGQANNSGTFLGMMNPSGAAISTMIGGSGGGGGGGGGSGGIPTMTGGLNPATSAYSSNNPYHNRGLKPGEVRRAHYYLLKSRIAPPAEAGDLERDRASKQNLPKLYQRVECNRSFKAERKFESFDFRSFNKTCLPGLTNDLANCYVNPVLQVLHFVPELRSRVMSHTCEREFCLTCELSFLSHMLNTCPPGSACQPLNFLRTLRQVREAAALGLIEGNGGELEARSEKSPAKRIQAFQRFILEQLHKEESSNDGKTSSSTALTSVEESFGIITQEKLRCAQCARDEKKEMRKFQIDLQYPNDRSIPRPSFVDLLVKSMCIKQEVRAWCESHKAYTRMAQTKFAEKLPNVLSISLGMRDMLDLHWWGVKSDAIPGSEGYSEKLHEHWLPHFMQLVPGAGTLSAKHGSDVKDFENVENGIVYELTGLVVFARKPNEKPQQQHQHQQHHRDISKLEGHLVSFIKVKPPYVDTPGCFDVSSPVGMTPGVSPLVFAGKKAPNTDREEKKAEVSTKEAIKSVTPSSSKLRSNAMEFGVEKAEPFTPKNVSSKTVGGRLDNGGSSSGSGTEKSEWLLFNDFSVSEVSKDEVTQLYGHLKLPCLCLYTRVDKKPLNLPDSPITEALYRKITLGVAIPKSVPFKPFSLQGDDIPSPGYLVGIDAEFVQLVPAIMEKLADGSEVESIPARLGLARISVVRGQGSEKFTPVIDDYIRAVEPVNDYLTRFSGLVPGDLDPAVSSHFITQLKHAYLKLRYLIDCGCIFVGHGLKQDFKMINIVVPPSQIIDTVELFHFKRQRKLGLKFLSKYLLKEDIQSKTHDSIEDARTALKLYEKYEEMQMYGDFDEQLLEIYRFGKMFGFKEVDEVPAEESTARGGNKNTTTTAVKSGFDEKAATNELVQSTSMLSFGANEFLPPSSSPPPHLSSQNVHHSSAAAVAAAAAAAAFANAAAHAQVQHQAQQQQQQQQHHHNRAVDNVLAFNPPPPPPPAFAPPPPPPPAFAPPPMPNMAPPAGANQRFAGMQQQQQQQQQHLNNNMPPPPGGARYLAPQPPAKPPPLPPRRL
jgi:PAB-dependent poly(A)-specific ribonuclease subunit 2